jgi:hypothetical protein
MIGGAFPSISFPFSSSNGAFTICDNVTLEHLQKVQRISVSVLSRHGRMQSSGRVSYEKGLLRLRDASLFVPPNAMELPMLLLSHEEFKIKLDDATTKVHQQSLSSYDEEMTLAVSVYDMSVIPTDALCIGPTGRIMVAGQHRSTARVAHGPEDGDEDHDRDNDNEDDEEVEEEEMPPPPPPEEEEEDWLPAPGSSRYQYSDDEDDGNYDKRSSFEDSREERELKELAGLFGGRRGTKKERKSVVMARKPEDGGKNREEKENRIKNEQQQQQQKKKLSVSLSLEDVLEQMRQHQEQQQEQQVEVKQARQLLLLKKQRSEAEAAATPAAKSKTTTPASSSLTKRKQTRSHSTTPRTPLYQANSKYVDEGTGKVMKRPFLRKGSGETWRQGLRAREVATRAGAGKPPLASRGAPSKRVERGSHADGHRLTIGKRTTKAVSREADRVVSATRLAKSGEVSDTNNNSSSGSRKPPLPPAAAPYREHKDKVQRAQEEHRRKIVDTAHANATASASAWQFGRIAVRTNQSHRHLVASASSRRSAEAAREMPDMVLAGTGTMGASALESDAEIAAWRPPVSVPGPPPVFFQK